MILDDVTKGLIQIHSVQAMTDLSFHFIVQLKCRDGSIDFKLDADEEAMYWYKDDARNPWTRRKVAEDIIKQLQTQLAKDTLSA